MTETLNHAPDQEQQGINPDEFTSTQLHEAVNGISVDPSDLLGRVPNVGQLHDLSVLTDHVASSPVVDTYNGRLEVEDTDKIFAGVGQPNSWVLDAGIRQELKDVVHYGSTLNKEDLPDFAKNQVKQLVDGGVDEKDALRQVAANARNRVVLSDALVPPAHEAPMAPMPEPKEDQRNRPGHGTRGSQNGNGNKKSTPATPAAQPAPTPASPANASANGAPAPAGNGASAAPTPASANAAPQPASTPATPASANAAPAAPATPASANAAPQPVPVPTPETTPPPKNPVKAARKAYENAYRDLLEKGMTKGLEGDKLQEYLEGKKSAQLKVLGEELKDQFRQRAKRRGETDDKEIEKQLRKYLDTKVNPKIVGIYEKHIGGKDDGPEPEPTTPKGFRARIKGAFSRANTFFMTMRDKEARREYFNDEEKGRRRKVIAGVLGVAAAGLALYGAYAWGENVGEHAAQQSSGGTGGTLTPEAPKAPVHETASLTHKGDTIWHEVAQRHPNLHGQALHDEVQHTLDANNMSWEDAKHMHVGQQFNLTGMQPAPSGAAQEAANQAAQHTETTTTTEHSGLSPAEWVGIELGATALAAGAFALGRSGGKKAERKAAAETETETTTTTEGESGSVIKNQRARRRAQVEAFRQANPELAEALDAIDNRMKTLEKQNKKLKKENKQLKQAA